MPGRVPSVGVLAGAGDAGPLEVPLKLGRAVGPVSRWTGCPARQLTTRSCGSTTRLRFYVTGLVALLRVRDLAVPAGDQDERVRRVQPPRRLGPGGQPAVSASPCSPARPLVAAAAGTPGATPRADAPTWLSMAALAALVSAVGLQVRYVEEPYLRTTDSTGYSARVGRFVPLLSRFRTTAAAGTC